MLKHGWAEIKLLHHPSCQASLGMLLILSMEYWLRMAPAGLLISAHIENNSVVETNYFDCECCQIFCTWYCVWKTTKPTMVSSPFKRNIWEIILLLWAAERKIGVFPDCQKNKNKKNLKWWKMTHCRDYSSDSKENSFLKLDKDCQKTILSCKRNIEETKLTAEIWI